MNFFRVYDVDQFETYYRLKCQSDAINWSGFPSAPNRDNLFRHFINNIINGNKIFMYYLEDNHAIVGYVQGSVISEDTVEFSATNIFKEYQGQGYLQDMSSLFIQEMEKFGYKKIIGWASEQNKPAEYNLFYNKFKKLDEFDIRNLPLLGGEHKFYKWIKYINE